MAVKADRKKMKAQYIRGGMSYADIARMYKISDSTVKRWAKEDKWQEAKAEADRKAEQKMIDAAADGKTKVEAGVLEMSTVLLEKLANALENEPDEMEPGRAREYTAALRDLQTIRGDKNKLDLKEQKLRIKRLQEQAKGNKPEKQTIELIIAEQDADYDG